MNPDYCATTPTAGPNQIEWAFDEGQPSIVAHIPDGEGNYSAWRLDQIAPTNAYERAFARALLRLAQRRMDASEPTNPNGATDA